MDVTTTVQTPAALREQADALHEQATELYRQAVAAEDAERAAQRATVVADVAGWMGAETEKVAAFLAHIAELAYVTEDRLTTYLVEAFRRIQAGEAA